MFVNLLFEKKKEDGGDDDDKKEEVEKETRFSLIHNDNINAESICHICVLAFEFLTKNI